MRGMGSLLATRIIPALAGNTGFRKEALNAGSSPLSRGIRAVWELPETPVRIIPALAGNTVVYVHDNALNKDHPRSRGEYPSTVIQYIVATGSSPLSRGIQFVP